MSLPHKTVPVQVWADIDIGIADNVRYLNTIPGVRTLASCQGTLGEGGPNPYRAQIMCSWTAEAYQRLSAEFDITVVPCDEPGVSMDPLVRGWGYVHPRNS